MKAVGILGGTFDPIHLGHLICAQYVLENRNLEKIIFIPCKISPHKTNVTSADGKHRMEMIKLAITDIPYFESSDYEVQNDGISYTINTLQYLKNKYEKLELIIGEDNFLKLDTWKQPEEIIQLSTVLVLKRDIHAAQKENKFAKSVVYLNSPKIDISATDIRRRVQNNQPINFLVTEKVRRYIYTNNLYMEK